ncbi:MAG: Ldh family oxidoreductase [bacterium]
MEEVRFSVKRLEDFIGAALAAEGALPEHAGICARRMIEADLRGMHGHGIFRLASYLRRVREGGYNLRPAIRTERETPVSAVIDGDNALGQVVVTRAAELGIAKARESGLAWIGIRRGNHAGAGGVYAALALAHDMIGMYMAVANANHMPPWGGVDPLLSTNPIAWAVPAGEEPPIVIDMATTVASYGKVKVMAQRGETMPVGWMVDRKGQPLTDPTRAAEGSLLPIGGHKGYGLNLIIGSLAGVLNGAAFGSAVIDFNADFKTPTNTGQVFFAMRPDLFRDMDDFRAEMDLRIREIRDSTPVEGGGPVRIPGQMAQARGREMEEKGIPLSPPLLAQLREEAEGLGLADRLDG